MKKELNLLIAPGRFRYDVPLWKNTLLLSYSQDLCCIFYNFFKTIVDLQYLVQSFSHVQFFVTPWTTARQASLSTTNSQSPPKPMSIESVMPSNHPILCRPLLLLPSIFPSLRDFSNVSVLRIRWPKYWSFSLSISPSNEHPGLISFRMDWLDLLNRLKL